MLDVLVLNGPNLNLLGTRRPDVYGSATLAELDDHCATWGAERGLRVRTLQTNHEGGLIDALHQARGEVDGVVLNAGAYTHTSYALHDAIEAVGIPTVEVHISNVEEREEWRRRSVIRPACVASIYGRGIDGYRWALRHLAARSARPFVTHRYGAAADHVFDLRRADDPIGLAVLVHGGFWRRQWTRDTMDELAVDLAARGWTTANIEYRRVGTGGGWPSTRDDVLAAIREATAETGPGRTIVVGMSAGAHLALSAASVLADEGTPPELTVSLAGITDLVSAAGAGLGNGAVDAFLGPTAPVEASPLADRPGRFPVLLAHGDADEVVPPSQSERYAAAAGDAARLIVIPRGGHFGFLDADDPMWEAVARTLPGGSVD